MATRRRAFLTGAAAMGAAISLPRVAAARTKPRALRVLLVFLSGGARSSAAFVASKAKRLNPWGRWPKAKLPIGKVLDPFAGERSRFRRPLAQSVHIPTLADLTDRFSLIGTWDPARGDHFRSERVALTGTGDERGAGLLVRAYGGLDRALPSTDRLPGVSIGPASSLSRAPEGRETAVALELAGATAIGGRKDESDRKVGWNVTGKGFAPAAPAIDLDDALLSRTAHARRQLIARVKHLRDLRRELAARLAHPALQAEHPAGELGAIQVGPKKRALTNALLHDVFDAAGLAGLDDGGLASDAAVAIRFLQLGSPAVALTLDGFDMHSGERSTGSTVYGRVGGLWAGLWFVLSNTADPVGKGSMLDNTLVLTMSEFGRDPGNPATGFNGGGGSDHGSSPACFYVGHAVMGAGVPGGRVLGGVDTDTYDARKASAQFHPDRLLATVLHALGIPVDEPTWGFPGVGPIDLWSA